MPKARAILQNHLQACVTLHNYWVSSLFAGIRLMLAKNLIGDFNLQVGL